MDESGHSADPNILMFDVAGCVAAVNDWTLLEREWSEILTEHDVKVLHMRHLAHFRGEFSGWTEQKRQEFLRRSVECMNRHVALYVGFCVPLDKYRLMSSEMQDVRTDPYFGCFRECVRAAARETLDLSLEEKVEVVFAHHPEHSAKILEFYGVLKAEPRLGERLGPITFGDPAEVLPLQAADLVAYELGAEAHNLRHEPARRPRWPYVQLRRRRCQFQEWAGPGIIVP